MHRWSCDQCIESEAIHRARGYCGTTPFPRDGKRAGVAIEEDEETGETYVEGSTVVSPMSPDLEEMRFSSCPLVGMNQHFPRMLDLFLATREGVGLTPAALGIDVLTPGALAAHTTFVQEVGAKNEEFRKTKGDQ